MKLEQGDIRVLISSLFGVFIWVPYFIFSKRIIVFFVINLSVAG